MVFAPLIFRSSTSYYMRASQLHNYIGRMAENFFLVTKMRTQADQGSTGFQQAFKKYSKLGP